MNITETFIKLVLVFGINTLTSLINNPFYFLRMAKIIYYIFTIYVNIFVSNVKHELRGVKLARVIAQAITVTIATSAQCVC